MKCYLCGCEKHFQREGKVRDNPSIKILECAECGLVFLDTQTTNEEFYENNKMFSDFFKYAKREYDPNDMQKTINAFQNERKIQTKKRFDFCLNFIIGKDILDFGSGYAGFLIQAKEFAKSVVGVELEEQVAPIYAQHNIPLIRNLAIMGGGGRINMM